MHSAEPLGCDFTCNFTSVSWQGKVCCTRVLRTACARLSGTKESWRFTKVRDNPFFGIADCLRCVVISCNALGSCCFALHTRHRAPMQDGCRTGCEWRRGRLCSSYPLNRCGASVAWIIFISAQQDLLRPCHWQLQLQSSSAEQKWRGQAMAVASFLHYDSTQIVDCSKNEVVG